MGKIIRIQKAEPWGAAILIEPIQAHISGGGSAAVGLIQYDKTWITLTVLSADGQAVVGGARIT